MEWIGLSNFLCSPSHTRTTLSCSCSPGTEASLCRPCFCMHLFFVVPAAFLSDLEFCSHSSFLPDSSVSTFKEVNIVLSLVCSLFYLENVVGLQVSCFRPQKNKYECLSFPVPSFSIKAIFFFPLPPSC